MNNHLLAIFLTFLFVFLFRPCTCIVQNSRHPDEWFEELERQWIDEGRLPELTEDEILYRRTMKRREAAADKMDKYMRKPLTKQKDAAGMATNLDRIGRPVLMHITLTQEYVEANKDSDKDDLTWDQKADRCDEWLNRIYFRVKEVACFPNDGGRILITVKRDYEADDVWAFLETQTEIEELLWNEKIAHPYKLKEEL